MSSPSDHRLVRKGDLPGALDPAEQPGAVQDGFDMGEAFQVRRIEFLGEQAGGTAVCRWGGVVA